MQIRGRVVKRKFGVGSKSERDAIMLETDETRYVLNTQDPDKYAYADLEALVGKTILGHGTVSKQMFYLDSWDEEKG